MIDELKDNIGAMKLFAKRIGATFSTGGGKKKADPAVTLDTYVAFGSKRQGTRCGFGVTNHRQHGVRWRVGNNGEEHFVPSYADARREFQDLAREFGHLPADPG